MCVCACLCGLRGNPALFSQRGHSSVTSWGLSFPVEGHCLNVIRPDRRTHTHAFRCVPLGIFTFQQLPYHNMSCSDTKAEDRLSFRPSLPLPDTGPDPPAPSFDASLPLSAPSPCSNWQEINPALIYNPPPPSSPSSSSSPSPPAFTSYSPLPAVKCPFWPGQKHQLNTVPYQSRHIVCRYQPAAVSARRLLHTFPTINETKNGVATEIILGKNALLALVPVYYRAL